MLKQIAIVVALVASTSAVAAGSANTAILSDKKR